MGAEVIQIGLATVLMAAYLIWVAGKVYRFLMASMPRWVQAYTAEVQPFVPVLIVAFYVVNTWDLSFGGKGISAIIAAGQLIGWLALSDDDDNDRWKRRRRRLAERLGRRHVPGEA